MIIIGAAMKVSCDEQNISMGTKTASSDSTKQYFYSDYKTTQISRTREMKLQKCAKFGWPADYSFGF